MLQPILILVQCSAGHDVRSRLTHPSGLQIICWIVAPPWRGGPAPIFRIRIAIVRTGAQLFSTTWCSLVIFECSSPFKYISNIWTCPILVRLLCQIQYIIHLDQIFWVLSRLCSVLSVSHFSRMASDKGTFQLHYWTWRRLFQSEIEPFGSESTLAIYNYQSSSLQSISFLHHSLRLPTVFLLHFLHTCTTQLLPFSTLHLGWLLYEWMDGQPRSQSH